MADSAFSQFVYFMFVDAPRGGHPGLYLRVNPEIGLFPSETFTAQ
jgi:hypothetical protein